MKPASRLALCLALLWTQTTAAHHSFDAEFDRNKPVKLTGSVTRLDWGNPHIWIFMDVKDETGKVSNWGVEGGAPNALFRNGADGHPSPAGHEIIAARLADETGRSTSTMNTSTHR